MTIVTGCIFSCMWFAQLQTLTLEQFLRQLGYSVLGMHRVVVRCVGIIVFPPSVVSAFSAGRVGHRRVAHVTVVSSAKMSGSGRLPGL